MDNQKIQKIKLVLIELADEETVISYAKNDVDPLVREHAVEFISDQYVLGEIANTDTDLGVVMSAIRKLTNEEVIRDVASSHIEYR